MYDINSFIMNNEKLLNTPSTDYFNEMKQLNEKNYLNYNKYIKYKIHQTLKIKVNTNSFNIYVNNYTKKIQEKRKLEAQAEKDKIFLNIISKIQNVFLRNQDILLKKSPFENNIFLNIKNSEKNKEKFISQLHELLDEYNFFYDNFVSIEKYISNKIKNNINKINNIIDQIYLLNKKIQKEKIDNNSIYINIFNTERENLINQLNKIIAVHKNIIDSEDSVRIFDNILLVSDKLKYHIQNNHDPINKIENRLCFVNKSSNTIDIPLSQIIGEGKMSGLSEAYLNDLVPAMNQIRQIIFDLSQYLDINNKN
ncbi:FlgK family flagellar hook-associated protein [Buchnera aphidicola]|uniref:FlgK family flagellar hook-associated protein n=1 Tax=Buchnera aphidicola TaxID=9 RepID=UPI003463C400